jgi:hypothetical protein
MSAKSGLVVAGALALLLTCAATARIPGIHWLVGYGHESDYSFHPDDERFILSAKDFQNKLAAKRDGYPLFMVTQLFAISKFYKKSCTSSLTAWWFCAVSAWPMGLAAFFCSMFL